MEYPSINEDSRRRFEAAWAQGAPVSIESCLPDAGDPEWLPTLEELVQIELEFRWKAERVRGPTAETYVARFPALAEPDVLARIVATEYEVRREHGDHPPLEEYRRRFPNLRLPFLPPLPGELATQIVPPPHAEGPGQQLLFAVLALDMEFIDLDRFRKIVHAWAADQTRPMTDVLVDLGGMSADDRQELDRLAARKLRRFDGDIRSLLGFLAPSNIRDVIHTIDDPAIRGLLSSLPPAVGHVLLETLPNSTETTSRYTLSHLHAEGGLGRVWVARDAILNREVALKELKPQPARHPEAWRRFLKEAQVTGQLEHPNIVPVYELGRRPDDQQPFYTMRFVKGQTLRKAVAEFHDRRKAGQEEPLERLRLMQAFQGVCNAIFYAHSRGVVHRDLKPDNVILGGFGEVLVLDWGLAKTSETTGEESIGVDISQSADVEATATGSVLGTPAYMAPEQAVGRLDQIDARTDVYGLGAILFEILTGQPPHLQGERGNIIERIIHNPTPHARRLEVSTPPALDAICAKAMAKEPQYRYATAAELAQDIQRYLADEPVSVYREPVAARVARFVRRHRTGVAVASVVLLVGLIGSVAGLFLWQEAENERQRQAAERLLRLQNAAAADESLARNELQQDHFATAAEILGRAKQQLPEDAPLADLRRRIVGFHERMARIAEFYRRVDTAERLEFFEYDDRAEDTCEAALRKLGLFDQPEWWEHLPVADLSKSQAEQLREDVFREIILLGAIRAKRGVVHFADPRFATDYRRTLEIVAMAERYRPSQSGHVLNVFSRLGLLEVLAKPVKPIVEPVSPADYYFAGVMQFWFGQVQGDSITTFLRMAQPLLGIDFHESLERSDRWLRHSVSLNPRHYWTWFMLGWNKFAMKDYATAELVMSMCVGLRPDQGLGYSYRGLALIFRAKDTKDEAAKQDLITRGLADVVHAETLDPSNPELIWLLGQALVVLDRRAESIAAFQRAVDREQPLDTWSGRRVEGDKRMYLNLMLSVATKVVAEQPENAEAWSAFASANDMLGETDAAEKAADMLVKLHPTDPRGLAILGRAKAGRKAWDGAIANYEAAIQADPKYWRAIYGKARALAAAGKPADALTVFDQALTVAELEWQPVAVQLGRTAVLAELNRPAEAEEAFAVAKALDPRAVDPRTKGN